MSSVCKVCSFIYSIHKSVAPFTQILAYFWVISAQCGIEAISLWPCWGVIEAQVALIATFTLSVFLCQVFLIFHSTASHTFSMGFRSGELAGQSSSHAQDRCFRNNTSCVKFLTHLRVLLRTKHTLFWTPSLCSTFSTFSVFKYFYKLSNSLEVFLQVRRF